MSTTRPGRSRSEEARQAILLATRDELAERGYDKLSLDRVAAAAGVGKQTIYRWWSSKAALVAEGVLEGHLMPGLAAPSPETDSDDVWVDVASWLRDFGRALAAPSTAALLRATSAATAEDDEVAARYDEQLTTVTRVALEARFTRAVASGQVRADAPTATAVEALVGLLSYHIVTRRDITEATIDGVVRLLRDGVGG